MLLWAHYQNKFSSQLNRSIHRQLLLTTLRNRNFIIFNRSILPKRKDKLMMHEELFSIQNTQYAFISDFFFLLLFVLVVDVVFHFKNKCLIHIKSKLRLFILSNVTNLHIPSPLLPQVPIPPPRKQPGNENQFRHCDAQWAWQREVNILLHNCSS